MLDICRYIEMNLQKSLSLAELAYQANLSPSHFQRRFKSAIGISPKEYVDFCRLKNIKDALRANSQSITENMYDAGFQSSSRLYGKIDKRLGMTPRQYRRLGQGTTIFYASKKTALGEILMAATDRGLCYIQFSDNSNESLAKLESEFPEAIISKMNDKYAKDFSLWMKILTDYLNGEIKRLDLPLDIHGTAFQMKIWKFLTRIPPGRTMSYKELAEATGNPKAVRAVASACAKNRIAIAIPCHRVIRGDGDLAGYRWGIHRKRALLELESGQ